MFLIFQVVTVFLVAIAMSMAVAHALELPGKNAPGPGKLHRRADHLLSGIRLGGNERGAEHDGYCHTFCLLPREVPNSGGRSWDLLRCWPCTRSVGSLLIR